MRWSFSTRAAPQPCAEQVGWVHSRAMRWAALGPRPRWVTLATWVPLVSTSLSTESPSRRRATLTGT
ncbi:MAG: hypothetical protein ACR2G7_02245, partial [Acidimicrobiales bacterium]